MGSLRGEVPLEVCGKKLSIAPTYKAIEAIELRTGAGLHAHFTRIMMGDARVHVLAICVHEGLRGAGHRGRNGEGDAFSMEEIGEDVLAEFTRYSTAVGAFLGNALGGKKPGNEPPVESPPPPP